MSESSSFVEHSVPFWNEWRSFVSNLHVGRVAHHLSKARLLQSGFLAFSAVCPALVMRSCRRGATTPASQNPKKTNGKSMLKIIFENHFLESLWGITFANHSFESLLKITILILLIFHFWSIVKMLSFLLKFHVSGWEEGQQ